MDNRYWVLASRPEAEIEPEHFRLEQETVAALEEGEVLVAVSYLVASPPLRMSLTSGGITGRPVDIGAKLRGNGLARVIESRDPTRLDEVTDRAHAAIVERFGDGPVEGAIQAHVITALT